MREPSLIASFVMGAPSTNVRLVLPLSAIYHFPFSLIISAWKDDTVEFFITILLLTFLPIVVNGALRGNSPAESLFNMRIDG